MKPIIHQTAEMKAKNLCGEELDEIWWQGRQWAVTSHGIESLDGTYDIAHESLSMTISDETSQWPTHMLSKTWVDASDFLTAFMVACYLHGKPVPQYEFWNSVAMGRRVREEWDENRSNPMCGPR